MRGRCAYVLLITLAAVGAAAAAAEQKPSPVAMTEYDITGDRLAGELGGALEWSGNVTVTGANATATCDRLKVWLSGDGRYIERAEAKGHIVIKGRYVAADKTEWRIIGRAESAGYERKSGKGTLEGSVRFEATNASTAAVLSVEADRLVYDANTRQFRFEGVERPVRGQWQEPAGQEKQPAGAPQPEGGETESD